VKYPKSVKPGTTVTCSACEEVFTPPELVKKPGYDPEKDEDVFEVTGPTADGPERDKARHAAAAVRGGARRKRELDEMSRSGRREKGKNWLEGPEVWLLVLGLCAAIALPLILWMARR
jgi:hypothetical protein